jgi:hypothetical protein
MTREDKLPQAGTGHYVALCVFCLAVIFLIQLQAGLVLTNVLGVMAGALALVYRLRLGPMLVVVLVAAAQLWLQIGWGRYVDAGGRRGAMELADVVLCVALLGYVVGHYRLQGIWYHLLPVDVRQRSGAPRRAFPWIRKQTPVLQEKRSPGQITAREIAWLVATLPVWAVVAQLAWALIPQESHSFGLPPRLLQILLVLWLLAVGFWMAGAVLDFWKHRRHDPATAQLYLQDLLWRDTRGEQRRVNRWLAWWKLARKCGKKPDASSAKR